MGGKCYKLVKNKYALQRIGRKSYCENYDRLRYISNKQVNDDNRIRESYPLHNLSLWFRLFFVIEYVNGGDLMFHMQRQRKLPEEHARSVLLWREFCRLVRERKQIYLSAAYCFFPLGISIFSFVSFFWELNGSDPSTASSVYSFQLGWERENNLSLSPGYIFIFFSILVFLAFPEIFFLNLSRTRD